MSASEANEAGGGAGIRSWVLCTLADSADPSPTIAHEVNRAALRNPDCDLVIVLGADALPDRWCEHLRAVAASESTTATVSAVCGEDALRRHREQAYRLDAQSGLGAGPLTARGTDVPEMPAPRTSLVSSTVVYVLRSAFDLLGGMDETLSSSAAAIAEFGMRAGAHGLANLIASGLLAPSHPAAELGENDRAELARRHPALWSAAAARPSDALERALVLTSVALGPRLSVTVDARSLATGAAGTQVYTLALLRALAATGEVSVRALVAADEEAPAELRELENTQTISYDEALSGAGATDIVHRPQQVFTVDDLTLLRPLGRRLMITHLDLIAYHSPTYFASPEHWQRHVRATRIAMDAADRVLFLSAHARLDAEREALIDAERTAVVPLGVDSGQTAAAMTKPDALADRAEPFMLCLGSDYAHKNRPFALELTAALRAQQGWPGILVLAGGHVEHGSSASAERRLRDSDHLTGAVVDLGGVSEPERRWLTSNAAAVVYPTVLEGFGLVPLEAAVAGTPCLFAAQSSLRELFPAGLAALNRWDATRSAAAAMRLLEDSEERRTHLRTMREIARRYTWARCAELTLEAYRVALASRARSSIQAAWEAHERELEIVRLDRALQAQSAQMQALLEEIGQDGLALVGGRGVLSRTDQRALLALAARPVLGRPLLAGLRGGYRVLHRGRQ